MVPKELLPTLKDVLALLVGFKLVAAAASFVSTLVIGLLLMRLYPVSTQRALQHLSRQPLVSPGPRLARPDGHSAGGRAARRDRAWDSARRPASGLVRRRVVCLPRVHHRAAGDDSFSTGSVSPDRDRWAFVFGLCLYFFLTAVPFLGPFATLLAVLFGLGAVLLTKKDAYAEVRAQRLI
ncbi:MAG: hypothetical protein KatS3mg082_1039 [Nitrospiraceae bacterium]|nr:MAG: hypothetical protein KatS3mg082_1039 [Nitrospiraceae bacterium]